MSITPNYKVMNILPDLKRSVSERRFIYDNLEM